MIVLKSITINGICLTSCKCLVTWLTYVIISCFNKMSLCANVSFRSIDNGILNNLGPIHHPNVDGIEPVLLREMACDFLCIGLFPESALILSFNLHQNEPLVTNFKSVQWLWKKISSKKNLLKRVVCKLAISFRPHGVEKSVHGCLYYLTECVANWCSSVDMYIMVYCFHFVFRLGLVSPM